MKQTALQWLVEFLVIDITDSYYKTLFDKALEMEKEQIETAYKEGYDMGYDHGLHEDEPDEDGEKFYYKETFKSEEDETE